MVDANRMNVKLIADLRIVSRPNIRLLNDISLDIVIDIDANKFAENRRIFTTIVLVLEGDYVKANGM